MRAVLRCTVFSTNPRGLQAIEDAAEHYVHLLVVQRLRTAADRAAAAAAFERAWGRPLRSLPRPSVAVAPSLAQIGRATLRRAGPLEQQRDAATLGALRLLAYMWVSCVSTHFPAVCSVPSDS